MEIIQAIVLGLIEGITEFLPISSTGHLIVAEDAIGYKDSAETFAVVVQIGAILAVIWLYRNELNSRMKGLFAGQREAKNFWLKLAIATLPTAIVGLSVANLFDIYAVATTIAWALIVGGVFMWLIEKFHQTKPSRSDAQVDKISIKQSIMIGMYQVVSLIPGTSRAAATIMGGMLSGLDRVTATTFSFYLSMPIIILAGGYQLVANADEISQLSGGLPALAVGTVVSFVAALATIKWLLRFVAHRDFKLFAYYRIILGAIILLAMV